MLIVILLLVILILSVIVYLNFILFWQMKEDSIYSQKIDWTQKFLRQPMIRKKKVLHIDDVEVINVWQIKRLRFPQILLFGRSKVDIDSYLSEYDDAKEPNQS